MLGFIILFYDLKHEIVKPEVDMEHAFSFCLFTDLKFLLNVYVYALPIIRIVFLIHYRKG